MHDETTQSSDSGLNLPCVGAVVVTFHPEASVEEHLRAVRPQVDVLVVVDNGSSASELEWMRRVCGELQAALIENGENLGIATALNVGVRAVIERGLPYVLLFDQDSCATPGFAQAMLTGFERSPWGARLGILVPRYMDRRLNFEIPPDRVSQGLEAAMTSGSLIRSKTFADQGLFMDALFIDAVDYEFSLRLRQAGSIIDQCDEAVLLHAPGEPVVHRFRGRRLFQTANYTPIRRYYQERNKIWVARRYFQSFPVFCAKLFLFSAKDFVKILVAESGKWKKCRFFLRGVVDGLRGRMGRLELPPPPR